MNHREIFSIRTDKDFEKAALTIFHVQAEKNVVYRKYIRQIGVAAEKVNSIRQIPFLPIEFFKSHKVITYNRTGRKDGVPGSYAKSFLSSGTTGMKRNRHYVSDICLYEESFRKCFEIFYGNVHPYALLALLPSYTENKNSSLIYMVKDLIKQSKNKNSAFYDYQDNTLQETLKMILQKGKTVILFGVAFALLDVAFASPLTTQNLIIIETGGMKGRGKEITREELHNILCEKFHVKKIHSEYSMTELMSQAYSKGGGIFCCPPWMKVLARNANDPFQYMSHNKPGALNIMDLANIYSCSFIATQDIGKVYRNNTFEVLGRMDGSDLRGCNLLAF